MRIASIAPALLLAGCVTRPAADDRLAYVGIGETAHAGGLRVTPLTVIEDSRCPKGAQCVWAGRLQISVRIDLGLGSETRDLTLGEPQPLADGRLVLVEARPYPTADRTIEAAAYRFAFRFIGGL